MKRTTWLVAAIVAASGIALAHPPEGGRRGPPIDEIATQLGLDATQKTEVQRIFEAQHAKRAAEREASRAELRRELSTVLTAEQLTKLDSLMKQRHRRRGPPSEAEG